MVLYSLITTIKVDAMSPNTRSDLDMTVLLPKA